MFHKAVNVGFKEGTVIEVGFRDGTVKQYDVKTLYSKYPQLRALEDRKLFVSGRLEGQYGIIWTEDLDLETETVYQEGITVRSGRPPVNSMVADAVISARAKKGLSQNELSELTGIDQSDISRIERGAANPSVNTLNRIADALDASLAVSFIPKDSV